MVKNDTISVDGWLAESRRPLHNASFKYDDPVVDTAWNALQTVSGVIDGDMRLDFVVHW